MGNGNLTMVYRAKNGQEATAGLDLDMEDVKVEKLIALFPSIDTLVPMLRSFEGVLDCQVTATCKMDSTMSLIMPSINSSCYLHGNNMVLLDGETFTEISKTLMFKNKKRNMIDSISVDLAIKDNKIEVFPFLVEMDRYKVAVGGTHNLDMTFWMISSIRSRNVNTRIYSNRPNRRNWTAHARISGKIYATQYANRSRKLRRN